MNAYNPCAMIHSCKWQRLVPGDTQLDEEAATALERNFSSQSLKNVHSIAWIIY
jgi:hypothetical protein